MSCLFGLTEIGSYRNYLELKHVFLFYVYGELCLFVRK